MSHLLGPLDSDLAGFSEVKFTAVKFKKGHASGKNAKPLLLFSLTGFSPNGYSVHACGVLGVEVLRNSSFMPE